jgi:AcrR family transcriptional regulator
MSGPRERLLEAASELTYTEGVGVGVDAILKEADVARRSLYQHFGSKDGLLAEVIRTRAAQTESRYAEAMSAGGDDPAQRLLGVFDYLEQVSKLPEYRGCRYVAAAHSIPDPEHAVRAEVTAHKRRVHELLAAEFTRLGAADPGTAADQYQLLIEGTMTLFVIRPEAGPVHLARTMAESLIRQASRR